MYTPCQQRMQYLVEFTLPEDSTHSEEEGEEQVGGAKEAGEEDEGESSEQPTAGEGRLPYYVTVIHTYAHMYA